MTTTTPPAEREAYTYIDKSTGRRVSFTPKPDEAMVTFPGRTADAVRDLVAAEPLRSVSQGYNLDEGFAAVYVHPADGGTDATIRSLDAQPQITASLPVMTDEHGAPRYFVPGELTVRFTDDTTSERAEALIAELGSQIRVRQRTPGYYTVSIPDGSDLFAAIAAFTTLDEVRFAEPSEAGFNDALYRPDDPDYALLWGMHNTGQVVNGAAGTSGVDIKVEDAWEITRGHPDVIVAVIDTGADLDHPDLQPVLFPRGSEDWNFAEAGPEPVDADGHGTHVAGTAVGADNTVGVIGVAPGCRLMPLRVNLTAGQNQNRADAINYVALQARANPERRYVINCSWKMSGDHAGVRTAIEDAVRDNVVVVFAAGNANQNTDVIPMFPGVYPQVICVSALDSDNVRAGFSNFGANVDIAGPGVNIWSSFPNDTHVFLDGTSMASPHVAGVAALVWSRNRNLTNDQVRRVLESTADDVDGANPGFVGMLGRGRVNAYSAVTSPLIFPDVVTRRADLTGDGRADLVGFGDSGVWTALNRGDGTYVAPTLAVRDFGYFAGVWRVEKHVRTLADVTGDGRSDIVGFGDNGVWVSRNRGDGRFRDPTLEIRDFAYLAGLWRVERHPRFVVDVSGDGRADIVGFGDAGVYVSHNRGGGRFDPPVLAVGNFGYVAGGWRVEKHPRFLADITGDGRPDIVGFGDAGVWVSRNLGGGSFAPPAFVLADFGYAAGGWRVDKHPRMLADTTGDGRADIVGFGDAGVWVATADGAGGFNPAVFHVNNFGYGAGGWRVEKHPRFAVDTTGDGRADIVGFGDAGVWIARNNGDGTFAPPSFEVADFGYNGGGWRVEKHPRYLADTTGDGRADIVGFGDAGVWQCLVDAAGAFSTPTFVIADLGYVAGGWRVHRHPRAVVGPR